MVTRRLFLVQQARITLLGLVSGAVSIPLIDLFRTKPVLFEAHTHIPKPMTLAEFEVFQRSFVNVDEFDKLMRNMYAQAQILHIGKVEMHADHARWTMSFASKRAFDRWNRHVGANKLVNESLLAQSGARLVTNVKSA
jgi:hypothetical protein